jgi:hypothetical protein
MNRKNAFDYGTSDMRTALEQNVKPYLAKHGRGPLPQDLEKLLRETKGRAWNLYNVTSQATLERYRDGIRAVWNEFCSDWNRSHNANETETPKGMICPETLCENTGE